MACIAYQSSQSQDSQVPYLLRHYLMDASFLWYPEILKSKFGMQINNFYQVVLTYDLLAKTYSHS